MFTRRKKEEEESIFKIELEFLLKNIKSNGLLCINININVIFIHIFIY